MTISSTEDGSLLVARVNSNARSRVKTWSRQKDCQLELERPTILRNHPLRVLVCLRDEDSLVPGGCQTDGVWMHKTTQRSYLTHHLSNQFVALHHKIRSTDDGRYVLHTIVCVHILVEFRIAFIRSAVTSITPATKNHSVQTKKTPLPSLI